MMGVFVGGVPVTPLEGGLVDTYTQATGGSFFSDFMDFGDADANRTLVLLFGFTTAVARSVTSVAIGGVTATQVALRSVAGGGQYAYAGIYKAAVPTGTSGIVRIDLSGISGSGNGCFFALYRLIGTGSNVSDEDDSTGASLGCTLNVVAGDFLVGIAVGNHTPSDGAVAGLSQHWSQGENDTWYVGGAYSAPSTAAGYAMTASFTGSFTAGAMAVAAFRA